MNLLGMLLDPQGSPALKQLTSGFGIDEDDARNAIGALVPALTRGMQTTCRGRTAWKNCWVHSPRASTSAMSTSQAVPPRSRQPGKATPFSGICSTARISAAALPVTPLRRPASTPGC